MAEQRQAPDHGSNALPEVVFSDGCAAACDVQVVHLVDLQIVQASGLISGCSIPLRWGSASYIKHSLICLISKPLPLIATLFESMNRS